MKPGIEEQLKCVRRELAMRQRAYPKWIASGRMKKEDADREIAAMTAVLNTLTKLPTLETHGVYKDAALWREFEQNEAQFLTSEFIDLVNDELVKDTEGNSDLSRDATSGDWDRIFETFLYMVKRRIFSSPTLAYPPMPQD